MSSEGCLKFKPGMITQKKTHINQKVNISNTENNQQHTSKREFNEFLLSIWLVALFLHFFVFCVALVAAVG